MPLQVAGATPASPEASALAEHFGRLPLAFVPNAGQSDPAVRFEARGMGGELFFMPNGVMFALPLPAGAQQVARLYFEGASASPTLTGAKALPGVVNYFLGDDPAAWHTGLPTYSSLIYAGLYPGIDLHYEGVDGALKSTYFVAPGADPAQLRWRYAEIESLRLDAATGDLLVALPGGVTLVEHAPVAWQDIDGVRAPVEVRFRVAGARVSFDVGRYDPAHALTLDPKLEYSTFIGGSGQDWAQSIALDSSGNVYIVGTTFSTNFPTVGQIAGARGSGRDMFVAKLNPTGTALLYSSYIGGSASEYPTRIDVDGAGNASVTGLTDSTNYPLMNAAQGAHGGGMFDAYVTKLNAAGSGLVYSTYLGGSAADYGLGIAADTSGNVYVTGLTSSTNFPVTGGVYQTARSGEADAFVTKFDPGGVRLLSTYLGGTRGDWGYDVAVDSGANIYVTGFTPSTNFPTAGSPPQAAMAGEYDAFVTKLNAAASGLVYSTYLGGSSADYGYALTVDGSGNAYVTGSTFSVNFPVVNAVQPTYGGGSSYASDAFVAKLNPAGSAWVYSTFLGGGLNDVGQDIAASASGKAWVTGYTTSSNFPVADPLGAPAAGGTRSGSMDAFVTGFSADGSTRFFSSYLGGSTGGGQEQGYGIAVSAGESVYVAGLTDALNYPVTTGAYQTTYGGGTGDAFVAKISPLPGTVTLIAPSGTVTTLTPTFQWNAVEYATGYELTLDGPTDHTQTFDASICAGGVCSTTLSITLANNTAYQWRVRGTNASGVGAWSAWMAFNTSVAMPPGATTLISPEGTIYINNPTYRWNAHPDATWYRLEVTNASSTVVISTWYQGSVVCSGGVCAGTPTTTLTEGEYDWRIMTWNDAGDGPWSTPMHIIVSRPRPATLISPTGTIYLDRPAYTWNAVAEATHYYLKVVEGTQTLVDSWYTASAAGCGSGTGTCTVTPDKELFTGLHSWQIQTYSSAGYGDWSTPMEFTPSVPAAAVPDQPFGDITVNEPTYTWPAVTGATWYRLWIDGGARHDAWYDAAVICTGGTCSTKPNVALPDGAHNWQVRTWNSVGDGPWSTPPRDFNVIASVPTVPTQVAPTGTIYVNKPTYTWLEVIGATDYQVQVDNGALFSQWYTDAVCTGGTCAVTPDTAIPVGAHTWRVRAYNLAGYGDWQSTPMGFTVAAPPAPTLVSPTNGAAVYTKEPTYTWNEAAGATWYQLWVDTGASPGGFNIWYTTAQACSGGVCAATPTGPSYQRAAGAHTWRVRGWAFNPDGYGAWSETWTFNVTVPGVPTLVSPIGGTIVTVSEPTYTWTDTPNATYYNLWVASSATPSTAIIDTVYQDTDICDGANCVVTPDTSLANDTYSWYVRAGNAAGYGPWTAGETFVIQGTPPGMATLISPSGTIFTNKPTYIWNVVADSTWYYLWVNGPSGNVIKQWYESVDVCTGATCQVTHSKTLANGAHTWWIQTWNPAGDGPWSAGMPFTVSYTLPAKPTLVSPNGTITTSQPTYIWNVVPGATWYQLWVNDPGGATVVNTWYTAADVGCTGYTGTCSATPGTVLVEGTHTWWVRGYNSLGNGPWSDAMSFTVDLP